MPRGVALIVWPALLGTVHIGVPLELSRLGPRSGWRDGRPGRVNLMGLAALAAGAGLLIWAVAGHYAAAPDKGWAIKGILEPEYLLVDGAYGFTRNPMYVGGAAMWAGWAVLLGSAPVAGGLVVLTGVYRLGVGWEEQMLERRWGEEWSAYAARTPRWLGPQAACPEDSALRT